MKYPISSLSLRIISDFDPGTFINIATGSGFTLGVVVEFGNTKAVFILDGPSKYKFNFDVKKYYALLVSTKDEINAEFDKPAGNGANGFGQLIITEKGPFLTGNYKADGGSTIIALINLSNWVASIDGHDGRHVHFFNEWTLSTPDGYGNNIEIIHGEAVVDN